MTGTTSSERTAQKIRAQIAEMIVIEKQLRELSSGESVTSDWISRVVQRNESLKNTLTELYETKKTEAQSVAMNYRNTIAIRSKIQNDIDETNTFIQSVKDEINSANRMSEIADYQLKKQYAYRDILKVVAYVSIVIIILLFLMTQPWFPKMFGKGLIILLLAYGLYSIIGQIVDNFRREDKYWDKYQQFAPQTMDESGKISLSKWEHNKRAISKMLGGLGGTAEICKVDPNKSDEQKDEELAQAITAGTMNQQNANIGDLG